MARILTPFGKIHIRRDERETLYQFEKQEFLESADVFKRKYKIRLSHISDGAYSFPAAYTKNIFSVASICCNN